MARSEVRSEDRGEDLSGTVRRIAILVTSLDAAAGRQLMMAMPSHLARDVRKAMSAMTSIDPVEQRKVLAEFRAQAILSSEEARPQASSGASSPHSVDKAANQERMASAARGSAEFFPAHAVAQSHDDALAAKPVATATDGGVGGPWQQLEIEAITELLLGERASVIAVLLSQIPPGRAAAVLSQLPKSQHRNILTQLSRLGEIDPEAMAAIDDYLASRIADYHHRRASETESLGRMQELLAAATPELRSSWQEIITETDNPLARRLGIASEQAGSSRAMPAGQSQGMAQNKPITGRVSSRLAAGSPSAAGSAGSGQSLADLMAANVITTADAPVAQRASSGDEEPKVIPFPAVALERASHAGEIQEFEQILKLAPHQIARILAAADGQVVLLALAGASPAFMQRFTAMLDKQDSRDLQNRLKQLGTIHLQDVDEAQRRLCELASQVVAEIRRGNNPALAAAA